MLTSLKANKPESRKAIEARQIASKRAASQPADRSSKAKMNAVTVGPAGERSFALLPPEGVPVRFNIASMGSRFGALMLDILITYTAMFLLFLAVYAVFRLEMTAWIALLSLVTFLVRTPYYIITELLWNGRTLGKRMVGIRVVSTDGKRLTPHQITVRNLMREAEFFLPLAFLFSDTGWLITNIVLIIWAIALLCVPMFNAHRQRLGDMIAGTYVVETPKPVLAEDMSLVEEDITARFHFHPIHLDAYGTFELQKLEDILQNNQQEELKAENIDAVARTIIKKIGYAEPVNQHDQIDFLRAFYKAQRLYLEQLKLYGKERADKYFADGGE